MCDFDFDTIDYHAKAFHRMKFLFGYIPKVTSEFCMSSLNNDFHRFNNVTTPRKM